MNKLPKKTDLPKYDKNPYMTPDMADNVKQSIQWVGSDNDRFLAIRDKQTGADLAEKSMMIGYRKDVDRATFLKLYIEGVAAILNLTGSGKRVFALIYMYLRSHKDTDIVILPYDPSYGMSSATFSRGLRDCIVNKILARTKTDGAYFINPTFVYNGNRLVLMKEYHIISDDDTETARNLINRTVSKAKKQEAQKNAEPPAEES